MSVTNFDITLDAPISPLENTLTQDGPALRGIITDQWGIDSAGNAYWDPDGVDPGDAALLSIDESGDLVLTPIATPAQQAAGAELDGVRASHRRFTATPRETVQRAYRHDSDGRLFAAAPQTVDRGYLRRADGHLFPHAPIHATPTREGDE